MTHPTGNYRRLVELYKQGRLDLDPIASELIGLVDGEAAIDREGAARSCAVLSLWSDARDQSVGTLEPVKLATYQSCTFAEKRAVLQAFWSSRASESEKVNRAADEYGPYALAMVAVITAELALISALLLADHSAWAWWSLGATALSLVSLRWTRVCQRARRAELAGA